MTVVLAALSDTHVNSYVGLTPPGQFKHGGGYHKPNSGQRYIARQFREYANEVEAVAERFKAPIVTIFNGDACDMHPKTTALITYNPGHMLRMTVEAIKPLVDISRSLYFTVGTKSHTGWYEHKIAEDLQAIPKNADAGEWAWDSLKLNIEGYTIWAEHHASMGRLFHTQRNAANTLAAHTISDCGETGERKPNLVLASHQHRWADSSDNYSVRALYLPAWQLPTGYIKRLKRNAIGQIGAWIAVIEDGALVWEKKYRVRIAPDRAVKVQL